MIRLLLALALIGCATLVQSQTVTVDEGVLEGRAADHGVIAWLGIPFAAPPVRELRWKAPQPEAKWTGVLHADRAAPMCLQPLRNRTMNHYFGNEAVSEDCLYLNVWAQKDARKRPVLVWIYGGGFTVGSASMANYDGAALAAKGVVRVNIAYRLGALGFLAHPDLSREGGSASGNYGLMDQIAALHWIKHNIAAFGGDPDNVTIAGQSAGSMSVALLQQSPLARGLFHKIIGMSGSPFGNLLAPVPLAQAEAQGSALQTALAASGIEAMRDLGGDKIMAVAATVARDAIVIDGKVLTASPQEIFARHAQTDVPIMMGFTRDESFSRFGPATTMSDYQAVVRKQFPHSAESILSAWPAQSDADVARSLNSLQRDASVGTQMAGWAKAQKQYGTAPAFVWFFTRRQPYAAGITFSDHDPATVGAYHTGDVPYWFQTLDSLNLFRATRTWTAEDRDLADRMSDMIVSFARTGKPSKNWPAFDPHNARVMRLDLDRNVIDWPNFKALHYLETAPALPVQPSGKVRD
jgi:para-nitrobenzyl esterase